MLFLFYLFLFATLGLLAGGFGFEIWKGTWVEIGLFVAGLLLESLLAAVWLIHGKSCTSRFGKLCAITGIWIVSWCFFRYFGSLPGRFAWLYLFAEPWDSWSIIVDSFRLASLLICLGLSVSIFFLTQYVGPKVERVNRSTFRILFTTIGIVLFCIVFSGFRTNPGKGSPGLDLGFSLIRSLYDLTLSPQNSLIRLQPRVSASEAKPSERVMPFNVLLIVHESLRSENLSIYSYENDTTPKLDSWLNSLAIQSHDVYKFQKAYSNATFTHLSLPSLLSGVHPIEGVRAMHTRPLLYESIKSWSGAKTAIISAHSYEIGNYASFFRSPSLDWLIYRETEGWDIWNNRGADDEHLVNALSRILDEFGSQSFFVTLHHNATHFPYRTPNSSTTDPESSYDESIKYVDSVTDEYFSLLAKRGLLDRTLIIITSDHGESFGENGTNGHFGPIHPSNSKIPFIWALPKTLSKESMMRSNLDKVVSNLDIVPTVLGMLGIPDRRLLGRDLYNTALKDDEDVLIYNLGTGQPVLYFALVSGKKFLSFSYQVDSKTLEYRGTRIDCEIGQVLSRELIQACQLTQASVLGP